MRRARSEPARAWPCHLSPRNRLQHYWLVRRTIFSPTELSAFTVLGNTARMALDSKELSALHTERKDDIDNLLELSSNLGDAARLDIFLDKFVLGVAGIMKFERAFVAAVEPGGCRLRWGSFEGTAAPWV